MYETYKNYFSSFIFFCLFLTGCTAATQENMDSAENNYTELTLFQMSLSGILQSGVLKKEASVPVSQRKPEHTWILRFRHRTHPKS